MSGEVNWHEVAVVEVERGVVVVVFDDGHDFARSATVKLPGGETAKVGNLTARLGLVGG